MKTKLILTLLIILPAFSFAQAQDIKPDDAEAIRKIIAERNFYKSQAEENANQRDEWKRSSAEWKTLYESEKSRSDTVQEDRITELKTALLAKDNAIADLSKANELYKQQINTDKAYIDSLEARNKSLKRQRWYFAGVGLTIGLVGGSRIP